MAKLSHFWKWQIGRFWYFDVSKESGETKSCFSGLGQIGELAPVRLNPSWSESRTPPSSSGIPKYHPDQLKHPFRHPKTKKTQPDTNRQCQMSSNTLRHPLKMHDWVRLEPILHIGPTLKGKIFFTRHFWDIKISKPPYLPLPKKIEFCHFSYFSCLSERNYNLQSLWITLYHGMWMGWDRLLALESLPLKRL